MPLHSKGRQVKFYIQALEDRVADLEILLNQRGDSTTTGDQWARESVETSEAEHDSFQPLLNAVRDLSLDVAGSYVGGASTITLGRALETALAGKTNLVLPDMGAEQGRTRQESFASDMSSITGRTTFRACQVDPGTAEKMVHAYIKHLCVNFPVLFTFDILALHERRFDLGTIYEESILNLILGLGAHFLEKVMLPLVLYWTAGSDEQIDGRIHRNVQPRSILQRSLREPGSYTGSRRYQDSHLPASPWPALHPDAQGPRGLVSVQFGQTDHETDISKGRTSASQ